MIDEHSQTWAEVRAATQRIIEEAAGALEATGLSLVDTEFQRGRIQAARQVLRLARPREPVLSTPPGTYA